MEKIMVLSHTHTLSTLSGFYLENFFFLWGGGGGGGLNTVYGLYIWEEREDFAKGAWRDV